MCQNTHPGNVIFIFIVTKCFSTSRIPRIPRSERVLGFEQIQGQPNQGRPTWQYDHASVQPQGAENLWIYLGIWFWTPPQKNVAGSLLVSKQTCHPFDECLRWSEHCRICGPMWHFLKRKSPEPLQGPKTLEAQKNLKMAENPVFKCLQGICFARKTSD